MSSPLHGFALAPRVRIARALLDGPGADLAELVQASGLPRRRIEELLTELEADLELIDGRYRVRTGGTSTSAAATNLPVETAHSGWDRALPPDPELTDLVTDLIAGRPAPDAALDHVGATADTLVRRAQWLARQFDLAGARVLCVGDHDLTALALAAVEPAVSVTVCDVDDRILGYLDEQARRRNWPVACRWADFRLGMPGTATGWADLVFTDPPYTPAGVETFLAAGLTGLRDLDQGRLVMAYGFGEHQPALGLKVQQSVLALHLALEAILPDFNSYAGAQAIGSHSDLYVCRPTARTWRALPTVLERQQAGIYTHGAQSIEAADRGADGLRTLVQDRSEVPTLLVAVAEPPSDLRKSPVVYLRTLLQSGTPSRLPRRTLHAVADLGASPASWALRLLLALDAAQVRLIVPATAADDLAVWRAILDAKYRLTLGPATDGTRPLTAERIEPTTSAPSSPTTAARYVLDRAHGKLANVWREALVAASRHHERPMTKNEARVAASDGAPEGVLETSLIELPQHLVLAVVQAVARTEADLLTTSGR